jgi:signal transduction histidine kinase
MRLPDRLRAPRELPRWLRSLRTRLLVATALIAVGAVGATAWLTSRSTTDRIREDVQQGIGVDSMIYDELLTYALAHEDWDEVESLVARLAEQTGRRIALTTEGRRLIVDSARLDGGDSPPLPRRPVAVVDPANPVGSVFAEGMEISEESVIVSEGEGVEGSGADPEEPEAPGVLEDEGVVTEGEDEDFYSEEDHALAAERADTLATCLGRVGVPHTRATDPEGLASVEIDWTDEHSADSYAQCLVDLFAAEASAPKVWSPESPDLLVDMAMTPEDVELSLQLDEQIRRCLDRRFVPYVTVAYASGGLIPTSELVGYDNEAHVSTFDECALAADERVYGDQTADPVRLYIGSRNRLGLAVLDAGRGPMLLAGGLVALLAVGITVLVSRRMLRPVVALTDAAQRMAGGDLDHRVDVQGRDELSELAHSFNTMASALAANEDQRKRMVNDVAHELRNPLANIRGYVEAALDGVALADDKLLGSLHEDALLLQRLVDDLQTLALAEAGRLALHRKPTDVVELATTVVSTHHAQAEGSGVELVLDAPSVVLVVDGDPARLRQSVGNLVSNALRYTPEGGTVTVRVRPAGGDHVTVAVQDTGLGIAAEDLPHVFDRFWRADRSRTRDTGGSGLGLAITRELVTAHNGRITATSQEGEGSTFTIRLPLDVPV